MSLPNLLETPPRKGLQKGARGEIRRRAFGAPERTLIKPYLKYRRTRAAANLNSGAAEFPRAARAARRGAARAGGVGVGWVGWGGVGRVCVFARVRACVRPPLCVCACACVCARVGARARDEAFESAALTCTERQSFPHAAGSRGCAAG